MQGILHETLNHGIRTPRKPCPLHLHNGQRGLQRYERYSGVPRPCQRCRHKGHPQSGGDKCQCRRFGGHLLLYARAESGTVACGYDCIIQLRPHGTRIEDKGIVPHILHAHHFFCRGRM